MSHPPTGPGADAVVVAGATRLAARCATPGDKSMSHRALLLGALAEGTSVRARAVRRRRRGPHPGGGGGPRAPASPEGADGSSRIDGGPAALHAPAGPLDCGNSGTGHAAPGRGWPRLHYGGRPCSSATPRCRAGPWTAIAEPLRRMGASVAGPGRAVPAPRHRRPGGRCAGIDYTPPVASAQVKSCVLLAGLDAEGETVVREPVATRPHTEELLARAGADISVERTGRGRVVRLRRLGPRAARARRAR